MDFTTSGVVGYTWKLDYTNGLLTRGEGENNRKYILPGAVSRINVCFVVDCTRTLCHSNFSARNTLINDLIIVSSTATRKPVDTKLKRGF